MESMVEFDLMIGDAVRLLESMGKYYGAERAMELWHAMGRELGDEVKSTAFMKLLTGSTGLRPRILAANCTQAVAAIKAIRIATGLGLKEAKDLWDASKSSWQVVECISQERSRILRHDLADIGMMVE